MKSDEKMKWIISNIIECSIRITCQKIEMKRGKCIRGKWNGHILNLAEAFITMTSKNSVWWHRIIIISKWTRCFFLSSSLNKIKKWIFFLIRSYKRIESIKGAECFFMFCRIKAVGKKMGKIKANIWIQMNILSKIHPEQKSKKKKIRAKKRERERKTEIKGKKTIWWQRKFCARYLANVKFICLYSVLFMSFGISEIYSPIDQGCV